MIGCRPLTSDELRDALAAFSGRYAARDRLLLVLGVTTGFRVSELLSVSIGDVWRRGRPVQKIRVARASMKGRRQSRAVALAPFVRPFLADWLGQLALLGPLELESPLFTSRKGTGRAISRVQAYRILSSAFLDADVDLPCNGTHTMRKTYAATVYEAMDHNIFKLQRALGHASPASTVAYLSFDETELDEVVCAAWSQQKEN